MGLCHGNELKLNREVPLSAIPVLAAKSRVGEHSANILRATYFLQATLVLCALFAVIASFGLAVPSANASMRPDSFADLAEKLSPAVVNISTTQTIKAKAGGHGRQFPQFPPGSPFEDFFEEFMDRQDGQGNQDGRDKAPSRKSTSLGSGFVISSDGYIVTNDHVISGADEISVTFADGHKFDAKLIGNDPKTDVALLKIESDDDLPSVSFGDSDKARIGDWVLAIGNPFGLGGSVTAGIISGQGRNINAGPYDDFLQTDASINRGNSGGPMFNIKGEVIGINSAIFSPSGGSVGIGFAIPSSIARLVVAQLKEHGETRRGWLGVRIQKVTDDMAEGLGLKKASGALVVVTDDNGPAHEAGIEAGDVILSFDGKDVPEMSVLPWIVARTDIGRAVDVVVWRKGKRKKLSVTVARLDEKKQKVADAGSPGTDNGTSTSEILGMTVMALDEKSRERLGLGEDEPGVLVARVDRDSPAGQNNIRRGDLIVQVGVPRQDVHTPADVVKIIDTARDKDQKVLLFWIMREGEPVAISVRLDPK